MSDLPTASDIQAAINAGLDQSKVLPPIDGYQQTAIIPRNAALVTLPRDKGQVPRFLTAAPAFNEPAAFIAYVNAFKDGSSRIWYNEEGKFQVVFDYHQDVPNAITPRPRHGDHTAVLELKRSPEWKIWSESSEKAMGQQAFAEFIEDNARDLTQPDPVTMLRVASGLHATTNSEFRQATNLANGQIRIAFDETINGTVNGQAEEIPAQFQVGLRPFMGCDRYPVDCRLRYRIERGQGACLKLHYKALQMVPITETALEGIVAKIAAETGIAPALGNAHVAALAKGQ